ncbi:GNAT family N-acetyltransferase [Dermatophilaceae bacterium Sec6.4]|nr:GNAT family N-acetyltransferase [Actinomycetota bacterium]
MDDVRVRIAERDDALALGALQLRWDLERGGVPQGDFISRYADAWLTDCHSRPAWVATTVDGNPIGFVVGAHVEKLPSLFRPRNGWLHLSAVYVDVLRRRQGVGEQLLRAVLGWCWEHDITRIQLNADDAARGLYERIGFTRPSDRLMELNLAMAQQPPLKLF